MDLLELMVRVLQNLRQRWNTIPEADLSKKRTTVARGRFVQTNNNVKAQSVFQFCSRIQVS